jgi:uncharacterized membrane protein YsdA (DUF1294 family)
MGKPTRRGWSPERLYGTLALAWSVLVALGLVLPFRSHCRWYHVLAAWLAGVNLVAFAYFAFDKFRARKEGRRVPEMVLHGLALGGGSGGAWLAMRCFRHKTIKGRFRFVFWLIVALQLGLAAWVGHLVWQHHH